MPADVTEKSIVARYQAMLKDRDKVAEERKALTKRYRELNSSIKAMDKALDALGIKVPE